MKKVVPLEGFGGGGTPLNFKIVAYATEEEMLADTPTENTIGVVTDIPISEYYFDNAAPLNLSDGMVWIFTNTPTNIKFNILQDNTIMIYPIVVRQYVNNIWTILVSCCYLNGSWADMLFDGVLYDAGYQAPAFTGGWEENANTVLFGAYNIPEYVTCRTNDIYLAPTANDRNAIISTRNKVNISGFSSIHFDVSGGGYAQNDAFGLIKNISDDIAYNSIAYISTSQLARTTYSIDLSSIPDGEYYIACGVNYGNDSNRTRMIYKVWLT